MIVKKYDCRKCEHVYDCATGKNKKRWLITNIYEDGDSFETCTDYKEKEDE